MAQSNMSDVTIHKNMLQRRQENRSRKNKYVYCRGSHAKLSRWQGTNLQRDVL